MECRGSKMKEQIISCVTTDDDEIVVATPNLFNCPVCSYHLSAPIFQCSNGHVVCSTCLGKLKNKKCPYCTCSIGTIRNRLVEDMIESIKRPCQYAKYGCERTLISKEKHTHEESCAFAPRECPFNGCTFVGSLMKLSSHLHQLHSSSMINFSFNASFGLTLDMDTPFVVLREKGTQPRIFVLNNYKRLDVNGRTDENCVTVSCFGTDQTMNFAYNIKMCVGESTLAFESQTRLVDRRQMSLPSEECSFIVRSDLISTFRLMNLEIIIWGELHTRPKASLKKKDNKQEQRLGTLPGYWKSLIDACM